MGGASGGDGKGLGGGGGGERGEERGEVGRGLRNEEEGFEKAPARPPRLPPAGAASQPAPHLQRERERERRRRAWVCGLLWSRAENFWDTGGGGVSIFGRALPRGGRGGAKISLQPARWGAPVTTTTPYPPPVRGWMDGPRMCGGPEVDAACWPWNCYGPVILD